MKKFPDHPEKYNPIQLLHHMIPGIKFTEKVLNAIPPIFEISCEINGIPFSSQGN